MKEKIKSYFEDLNPKKLGLNKKLKVNSVSKLGMGTGNLNYLVKANGKKFVFRLNMELEKPKKSRREFKGLKMIEKLKIGPKARILDSSKKYFDSDLIILDYIEGGTLEEGKLSNEDIVKLAKLIAKIHLIKLNSVIKKLPIWGGNYRKYFDGTRDEENYIRKNLKGGEFLKIITETKKALEKQTPFGKHKHYLVLSHGDICEQNVIKHGGEFNLIDFEDLALQDPAQDIAGVITDFGKPFDDKQKELFISEYLKHRKDSTLRKRVEVFSLLKIYSILLWAVAHTLKGINKEMHEIYSKHNDVGGDISYVKTVFKRALRAGVIDKKYKDFDIGKMLK